jgi:hypothetical protein
MTQGRADIVSFFVFELMSVVKNNLMSAQRYVIFILTLCRSLKMTQGRLDIVYIFFLNFCWYIKMIQGRSDIVSFFFY